MSEVLEEAPGRPCSPVTAGCFQKLSPSSSFGEMGQREGGKGQGELFDFILGFSFGVFFVPAVTVFER